MKSGLRQRLVSKPTMARYRLSRRAAIDLEAVAEYTIERFGIEPARRYREGLKACFDQLVSNPGIGRRVEQLAHGLQRFEHQSHVVFYQHDADGLLIVRVFHLRMDVPRHL